MLTADDIRKKSFAKGFRGYDSQEVEAFLAEAAKEYDYLYMDNLSLKETVERISSKLEYYQQLENTMHSTLTVAQETAEEVKAASRKQAALLEEKTAAECQQLLAQAQAKAQAELEAAQAAADKTLSTAQLTAEREVAEAKAAAEKLRSEAQSYADRLRQEAEAAAAQLRLDNQSACQKLAEEAQQAATALLTETRQQVGDMQLEAAGKARKLVGDAEEKSRKLIFEAEARAALAENRYESQRRKSALHRRNMLQLLENQLEQLKSFKEEE